jgi:hypothetical protein
MCHAPRLRHRLLPVPRAPSFRLTSILTRQCVNIDARMNACMHAYIHSYMYAWQDATDGRRQRTVAAAPLCERSGAQQPSPGIQRDRRRGSEHRARAIQACRAMQPCRHP